MKVSNTGTAESNHARDGSEPPTLILRQWISPSIQTLPRLSDLTLQSGAIPGGGDTGGGGSTVIP
jgi:hypothetical protein